MAIRTADVTFVFCGLHVNRNTRSMKNIKHGLKYDHNNISRNKRLGKLTWVRIF